MKYTERELIVKCGDNCSCLSVDKFPDEDKYYVTVYKSYAGKSFYEKLKAIYSIIFGGEVVNAEVVLEPEDFEKLKNFADDIQDQETS